ncbi:MAG TPA: DUF4326 domain-containing protein [Kribbella sp.]
MTRPAEQIETGRVSPQRIQRKRTKGWRMPDGAKYVGRGADWGNPYVVGNMVTITTPSIYNSKPGEQYLYATEITREFAVMLYRVWVESRPSLVEQIRRELGGKDLACWCRLDQPCHADVLLEIANGGDR